MKHPKTIKLFLIDGDTNGRQSCELSNWTGKAYKIPRNQLKISTDRPEIQSTGVYMLLNKNTDLLDKAQIYIGEAENVFHRLTQHLKDEAKDFWNEVVIFISKDDNLNKAHIKYLENRLYDRAKSANRYELKNSQTPTQSSISESDRAEMEEFLENVLVLMGTLGYNAFEKIRLMNEGNLNDENPSQTEEDLFYINSARGASAVGKSTNEGFVVFGGSQITDSVQVSCPVSIKNLREKLLSEGGIIRKEDKLILTNDYLFSSPSAAAAMVIGTSANGLVQWKLSSGKTLAEFELGDNI